eukprot:9432964-Pyramimonas_sp.AAC.1
MQAGQENACMRFQPAYWCSNTIVASLFNAPLARFMAPLGALPKAPAVAPAPGACPAHPSH